jgi:4-hydroxy-3-methylbut-2-enyl diphosphate reductase
LYFENISAICVFQRLNEGKRVAESLFAFENGVEMKVLVAEKCGFCHGVRSAISMAEKTLEEACWVVYSLGPIIHNIDEVERLAKAGLRTVENIDEIESGTVIIRSHGAAPEQIARLRARGVHIVDATCVLVKRVQHIAGELEKDG